RPPSMIPRVSRRSRPRSRRWGIRGAEKAVILGALPLGVTGNTPDSGSGESWFEPRRGNSKRDARLLRVALLAFLGHASVLQAFTLMPLLRFRRRLSFPFTSAEPNPGNDKGDHERCKAQENEQGTA